MNPNRVKIKPKANMTVYDPAAKRNISELGAMIIFDSYWQRRLENDEIEVIGDHSGDINEMVISESLSVDGETKNVNNQSKKQTRGKQK